jgi:hypothetical protein
MPLDTISPVTLVLSSSVCAALMTQGLVTLRECIKNRMDSGFSKLYLALALEAYASQCLSEISDSESYIQTNGHAGFAHGNIPDLAPYPEAIEWKAMGLKSTTAALSFRVDIETTEAMISYNQEHMRDGDDGYDTLPVKLQAARLGYEALRQALELRKSRKIKPIVYEDPNQNVSTILANQYQKYLLLRDERELRKQQAVTKMMSTLTA